MEQGLFTLRVNKNPMNKAILKKQINKKIINDLKDNTQAFSFFLKNQNNGVIIQVLKNFGRLENKYSQKPLLELLNNSNQDIRSSALKNLAKMSDIKLISVFQKYALKDKSTEVRKEAVSAIGRLRHPKAIPTLIKLLKDKDPKVVMQAMRGLFVFSNNIKVKEQIKILLDHPNELIRETIYKELNKNKKQLKKLKKHEDFPKFLKNKIIQGDVQKILKYIPEESVHLTFTSPPYYNARDYSIYQSYNEYLSFLEKIFKEVHRITKTGRFFVLNTSPIIIPRISRKYSSKRYPIPYDIHPFLIKMGWEFVDDIVWVKPEASVKNRNAGFLQHRKPLGYKPNAITEMLMVYRKKTDKLIDWNIRQYNESKTKKSRILGKYDTTNIWKIDPAFDKVHSAVFPIDLCNKIIRYYSFYGDLVFDPFAGSGTLGYSANDLGRSFLLTEKETIYINRMKEVWTKKDDLFNFKKEKPDFTDMNQFITLSQLKK